MEINEEILDSGASKISLSGRMDLAGVNKIEKTFTAMTAPPKMAVIVDMSAVPYMSSIGIRALLIHAKSVTGRGGKYVLAALQEDVRKVLEVSGIDKLITICEGIDEAIQQVSA